VKQKIAELQMEIISFNKQCREQDSQIRDLQEQLHKSVVDDETSRELHKEIKRLKEEVIRFKLS
jgi:predicted  nucleic acid-binding Zn-ribbon protein